MAMKLYSDSNIGDIADAIRNTNNHLNNNGYKRLEYIASNGNQYLELNIKPNQDTKLLLDFQQTEVFNSARWFFGSRQSNVLMTYGFVVGSDGNYSTPYNKGNGGSTFYINNSNVSNNTNRHVFIKQRLNDNTDNMGTFDNNTVYSILSGTVYEEFETPNNLLLFNADSNGTVQIGAKMKVYECKIWKNGIDLSIHLIPAMRNSDDEIGMYDLVNDVFYTNQGTGNFTGGSEYPKYKVGDMAEAINDITDEINNIIEGINEPKCYIFKTEEEAEAFDGYKPQDKAIVIGSVERPFSPLINTYNYGDFFGENYFEIYPAESVTLDAQVVENYSKTYSYKILRSAKSNNGNLIITLTPQSCTISISISTSEAPVAQYTSSDGINYELTSFTDPINKSWIVDKGGTFGTQTTTPWTSDSYSIDAYYLSRFLKIKSQNFLKAYYYIGVQTDSGNDGSGYTYDLSTININNGCNMLPTREKMIFSNYSDGYNNIEGTPTYISVVDEKDIWYFTTDECKLLYDISSDKFHFITTEANYYKYNPVTNIFTTETPSTTITIGNTTYNYIKGINKSAKASYNFISGNKKGNLPFLYIVDNINNIQSYTVKSSRIVSYLKTSLMLQKNNLGIYAVDNDIARGASAFAKNDNTSGFIQGTHS